MNVTILMKNYNTDTREIRIFISSTFQDMHPERDFLMHKVFPVLRDYADRRAVSLVPVDLRWGITDEEARSGKVIQICLEEIENSHPFFIGMLGDRYGWCPSVDDISRNRTLMERWGQWLGKDIDDGLSVTEIEMQYGVLRNSQQLNAMFFIRNQNQPDTDSRLTKLKSAVDANSRYPVIHYSSLEEMGRNVEKYFRELVDRLYPEADLSGLALARSVRNSFISARTRLYRMPDKVDALCQRFLAGDIPAMVLDGPSGIGKSAFMANFYARYHDEYDIVCHFVGDGFSQGNIDAVVGNICEEIAALYDLHLPVDIGSRINEVLPEMFAAIPAGRKLILQIDALNQLVDDAGAKLMRWLPEAPDNVLYMLSTLPEDATYGVLMNRGYGRTKFGRLEPEERSIMVTDYLRMHSKSFSESQTQRIVASEVFANNFVMRSLLDELIAYGHFDTLDERIDFYLDSADAVDFFNRVLSRFEDDFGRDIVGRALSVIAFSRAGLPEAEVMDIARIRQIEWSTLLCSFRSFVSAANGRLLFSHQMMHRAIKSRYAYLHDRIRQAIIEYFADIKSPRAYSELAWQYAACGDRQSLYQLLIRREVFEALYADVPYELARYWAMLRVDRKSCKKYSFERYFTQIAPDDPMATVVFLSALGTFARDMLYDFTLARSCFFMAAPYARQNADDILTIDLYENLADVYIKMEDSTKPFLYLEKSLALKKSIYGSDHPAVARTLLKLANAFIAADDDYKGVAEKYASEAYRIFVDAYGPEYPAVSDAVITLGFLHENEEEMQRGIDIRRRIFGERHPLVADAYVQMAQEPWVSDTDRLYEKAIGIYRESYGESDPRYRNAVVARSVDSHYILFLSAVVLPLVLGAVSWGIWGFYAALQITVALYCLLFFGYIVRMFHRNQDYSMLGPMIGVCSLPNILLAGVPALVRDFSDNWPWALGVIGIYVALMYWYAVIDTRHDKNIIDDFDDDDGRDARKRLMKI